MIADISKVGLTEYCSTNSTDYCQLVVCVSILREEINSTKATLEYILSEPF